MMAASHSSESIRAVSEFFQKILEPFDEPIYYDRLRGYVSSSSDEIKSYVRKHYRGEELLKFFRRRSQVFTVTEDNCVEIKRKDKKKKKIILDEEHTEDKSSSVEVKPRKRQRMKVPRFKHLIPSASVSNSRRTSNDVSAHTLSLPNHGPKDKHSAGVWGQETATVDEAELEEDTLEYFKEHFRRNRDSHFKLKYHSLPWDVKTYLQLKYTKDKIHRYLLDHCDTFLLDDDGFVTVVEVDLTVVAEDPESQNDSSGTCDELNVEANPDNEQITADCIEQASEKHSVADSVITDGNEDSRNQQLINSPEVSSNYSDIVAEEHEDTDCNERMSTSEESVIDDMFQEFLNSEELNNNNDIHQKDNSLKITITNAKKKCKYDDSSFPDLNEEDTNKASDKVSIVKLQPHSIIDILTANENSKWTKELSAIYFFIKVIEEKHNSSVLIERIRGRLAQAPKDAFDYIKSNFKGPRFKKFFTTYPKIFFVNKQEVKLSKDYVSYFKELEKCAELSTTTQDSENNSLGKIKDGTATSSIHLQHSIEESVESEGKEVNEREKIPSANFFPASGILNNEHDIQTEAEKLSSYASVSTLDARAVSELPVTGNEKAEQTVPHNWTSDQTTCFRQLEASFSDSNTTKITQHEQHPDESQLIDPIHAEDEACNGCWTEVTSGVSKVDCIIQSIIQVNKWDVLNFDMGNDVSSVDSDATSLKDETLVIESEKCADSNLIMQSEEIVNSQSIVQGNQLDDINSDLDKNISLIDSDSCSLTNEILATESGKSANSWNVKNGYAAYQLADNGAQLNHLISTKYSSEVDDTLYEHTIINHESVDRYIFSESECFTISETCSNKDISDEDAKESFVEYNHSYDNDNMEQQELNNINAFETCSNKDSSAEDSKESFVEYNHSYDNDNMEQQEVNNINAFETCSNKDSSDEHSKESFVENNYSCNNTEQEDINNTRSPETCSHKDMSDEESKDSFVENNQSCDSVEEEEINNTNSPETCNKDMRKPLIENRDSDIKNCSQLVADLKDVQRNATIYDRDYEDSLQEQLLEDFPTYFSRFVCMYTEEHFKSDIDTSEDNIENVCDRSEVLDSSEIFDDEINDTLCISDTDNTKVGSIDDVKEQLIFNNNENCTSEVNVQNDFVTPTFDENNISNREHFSFSSNDLDDKVVEDKEKEIPTGKSTLVNDPFLNGSESSFIDNGKIMNVDHLADSFNINEADTTRFPLYGDGVVKTPDDANGDIVLKNLLEGNDLVLSKKLDEDSDIVTLEDMAKEDDQVPSNDEGKEDTDILENRVPNSFLEDLIEDHTIASSIEEIDAIISKVKEEESCKFSVVSLDAVVSKDLTECDVISKCTADEDAVVIQRDLVEDEVIESAGCETCSNQSSDGGLTSGTEYLSYSPHNSPSPIFVTHSNTCDNADSPTECKINIMTSGSSNIVKNSVDIVKKSNGGSKDIEDTFTMNTFTSSGSEDVQQKPHESDIDSGLNSNNDAICNAQGSNKNNFWFSQFSTRKHLPKDKYKFKTLEVNCSDNTEESGFESSLSTNSQEKTESCASDTLVNSPTDQRPLREQNSMSSSGRGDSLPNAEEDGCRSPSLQSGDDVFPCHVVASSSNEMVTVFYGRVILLTKNVCIAKCIENGLPIFCSAEFFKCHEHKTGLDACFGALTIGDMVCCSVLSPIPGTDIMISCQFSIAENESLRYWSPFEARNTVSQTHPAESGHAKAQTVVETRNSVSQTHPVENGHAKAQTVVDASNTVSQTHAVENGHAKAPTVVEVRDTGCQTISTGDIFLTQYHF